MKRVLTHPWTFWVSRALPLLAFAGMESSSAWASDSESSAVIPAEQASHTPRSASSSAPATVSAGNPVKIKSRTFENRRNAADTMTWVIQHTTFEDGLKVMTLAGIQFEEAFGLSLILLDDVAPKNIELSSNQAQNGTTGMSNKTLMDSATEPSDLFMDEPAQMRVQARSLLVDLNDLRSQPEVRRLVPACENGRRRAVIFLRATQLQRQLEMTREEAKQWTRFGRAACVRWTHFPEDLAAKNSLQTDVPFLPDEQAPKN